MQYPQLGTSFELACMTVCQGMKSRVPFHDLQHQVHAYIRQQLRDERRQVLLMGESFGATLALAATQLLCEENEPHATPLTGLVLVNPATSYLNSNLHTLGPACARLSGPLLALYPLGLLVLAALVISPATQLPAFISILSSMKLPALLNTPEREAFLGRVALGAFGGVRGSELAIGDLLRPCIFSPDDLRFRLHEWLEVGADVAEEGLTLVSTRVPALAIVGETDRLLPSLEESKRLALKFSLNWRGSVVVPGAGHASTLGNRVDLVREIQTAFPEFGIECDNTFEEAYAGVFDWTRGLVDRSHPALRLEDYTRFKF